MIYGRFGDPLTIVRLAVLEDVETFDGEPPDDVDKANVEAGAYVIVKYAETGKLNLYHIGFLKADGGSNEIQEAIDNAS